MLKKSLQAKKADTKLKIFKKPLFVYLQNSRFRKPITLKDI